MTSYAHDATGEPYATLKEVDGLLRSNALRQAHSILKSLYLSYPQSAAVHIAMAKFYCIQAKLELARHDLEQALIYEPNHPEALATLGVVHHMLGNQPGALDCLERALAQDGNNTEWMGNLGYVYTLNAKVGEAIALLERAVSLAPEQPVLRNNLGRALVENGRFSDALIHLNRALDIKPNYASALYNRGMARLGLGQLETGWPELDFRFQANCSAKRSPTYGTLPLWDGSSLDGKRIVVYAEQGLGDELLYASCIPDLAKLASQVYLQCHPRLVKLFMRSFPNVIVHGGTRSESIQWLEKLGVVDYQIPIGSLPRYLRRRLDEFPKVNTYLKADTERILYWRRRLDEIGPGLKVGFAWRSKLQNPLRSRRYTQLSDWLEMFRLRGSQIICLQYDDCTAELETLAHGHGISLTRFPEIDLMHDLDDSVALMSALDVVISVITSTFRLAAGAGVETLLLTPPIRNWVNLGTEGLPWYPTVRIIRQTNIGVWDDVVTQVIDMLRNRTI